jgi:hypothetical protein
LSKREVEQLVSALQPQPDIASSVRALSMTVPAPVVVAPASPATHVSPPPRPTLVAPLAPTRYLVRITVSEDTHRTLERLRALLRHQVPDGDPAAIIDRALTMLLKHVEGTKFAGATRPQAGNACPGSSRPRSRRISAAVRHDVWTRDGARCAFVGGDHRCEETGFLEFHHVIPFAAGGPGTVENLELRCRAHNAYDASRDGGEWRLQAPSGRS